jgi:acyl-CoA hydrolase
MSDAQLYADLYAARCRTAAAAAADITDGETLVVAMAAGQPPSLLAAIADRVRTSVPLLTDDSQIGANLQVCADEENRADWDQRG